MSKKNLVLGGILVVLIILAYLYQGPLKTWQENLGQPKNFLAKINTEEISRIEITQMGKQTSLEKESEGWKVAGTKDFFVKTAVADNLLSSLKDAGEADIELVSENKDKKNEFQTGISGIQVKLFQGEDEVRNFIIGKIGPDFDSSYVSQLDTDKTYLIKVNLFSPFNQPEWQDKVVFSSEKDKISKIRFQYPTREFTIEKKDDTWQGTIPYGFTVSLEKIEEILNIMSNLTAISIPEQDFSKSGLDQHLIIVQATGEGIDNTIMVGIANENDLYYVKKDSSDNLYFITKEEKNELDKQIWQLK